MAHTELVVTPIGDVVTASLVWRLGEQLHASVVLKACFKMVANGPATLVEAPPVARGDVHHGKNPVRSIATPSDLVPLRHRCDVWLVGHAYAPGGGQLAMLPCRLAVYREREAVLDKTIHVMGRRTDASARPGPFQRMELAYERAYGGMGMAENPVGVGASGATLPNLVDPADARRVACFAPLPQLWRNRLFNVPEDQRELLRRVPLEIPAGFDWRFFQAAPADQQAPHLRGDEWLVLDGLHPAMPRMQTQLPGVVGRIRAWAANAAEDDPGFPVQVVADTLGVDTDAQTFTVAWRGNFTLASLAAIPTLRLAAALELPHRSIDWMAARAKWASLPQLPEDTGTVKLLEEVANLAHTSYVSPDEAQKAFAVPFAIAQPSGAKLKLAPVPGAPWSSEEPPPSTHPALDAAPPEAADPQLDTVDPDVDPLMLTREGVDAGRAQTLPFKGTAPAPPRKGTAFDLLTAERVHQSIDLSTTMAPTVPTGQATPFEPEAPKPEVVSTALNIEDAMAAAMAGAPADAALPFIARQPQRAPRPAPLPFTAPSQPVDEPDPHRGDRVPGITATALKVVAMPWQMDPPQPLLTVIVKGSFDLIAGGAAELREESELPTGEVHHDSGSVRYPSDYAVFKPRADVVISGTAHAPGGSARRMEVGFRLGQLDRRIAVLGDRRWGRISPDEPDAFATMPLRHERAFGGAGDGRNPHGRGRAADADGVRRLPNLERHDALIGSPGDAPLPACFEPMPYAWRVERASLGTYDARWQKTRWPYFPEDFDYAFFQQAPPEQQLERIAGDEPWEARGMRAEGNIAGTLPGLRVQCFARRTRAEGSGMREVSLKLDTCAFDIDQLTLQMVWRGLVEVNDDRATELAALFVTAEPLDREPLTVAEAEQAYRAALAGIAAADEDMEDDADVSEDQVLRRADRDRADALRTALPFGGAQPEPPLPPLLEPEEITSLLQAAGADEVQIAAAVSALTTNPEPRRLTREAIERFLAGGGNIAELDLSRAVLTGVDLSELRLCGALLEEADLTGANLTRADLSGAQLGGATLTDVVMEECVLVGADLSGVRLDRARLRKANLDGADLTGAQGDDAQLHEVVGANCLFAEGSWRRARFDGASLAAADFTDAMLDQAVFDGASAPEIRLYNVRGEGVSFRGADLTNARADAAALARASMEDVRAEGSIWEGAILTGATFASSELGAASFERGDCEGVIFGRCRMREARLREAKLSSAVLIKADLLQADLEAADLRGADLRGANLFGAEVWKARLDGAKLDGANLDMTKLEKT